MGERRGAAVNRWSFTHVPTTHLLLCSLSPNRPRMVSGLEVGDRWFTPLAALGSRVLLPQPHRPPTLSKMTSLWMWVTTAGPKRTQRSQEKRETGVQGDTDKGRSPTEDYWRSRRVGGRSHHVSQIYLFILNIFGHIPWHVGPQFPDQVSNLGPLQ